MPNFFAYLVFFSWPLVVLWLLFRYPTKKAIFVAIASATLILPAALDIDLPLLPPLDKNSITGISLIIFLFLLRKKFRFFQPGLFTTLLVAYFIAIFVTNELNASPIITPVNYVQGLTYYDALSDVIRFILYTTPMFLGRYFSTDLHDTEVFFKSLVFMALIYTLPMLYEVRMSPLLHYHIYGYSPSSFFQQMRDDGFRPLVFVGHGLGLAFWLSICILAAVALLKNKLRFTIASPKVIVGYLFVVLIFCKTWSALAYAIVGFIAIYKLSPSKQVKWSFLIASLIFIYPMLKTTQLIPEKDIISAIHSYSPGHAESLNFRLQNENNLLARALEKPFFGWGGWGRSAIYSDYDGKGLSVTDGAWIIQIGLYGWIGFILYYSILILPLYYAKKTFKYIEKPSDQVYFASLSVILAICIVDSIPNTGMGPVHLFFAGALLGQAEFLKKQNQLLANEKSKSKIK